MRLQNYDYSSGGYYFITICTKNKTQYFGQIRNDKVILSEIGAIAEEEWNKLPDKYEDIELDIYQVMPDHFHGIIILNEISANENKNAPGFLIPLGLEVPMGQVPTMPSKNKDNSDEAGIRPLNKRSLSSILNHYKGAVKKRCKERRFTEFAWQPLFHDRIIRNETELYNIRKYISENPIGWDKD